MRRGKCQRGAGIDPQPSHAAANDRRLHGFEAGHTIIGLRQVQDAGAGAAVSFGLSVSAGWSAVASAAVSVGTGCPAETAEVPEPSPSAATSRAGRV